ncbi:MAG: hypothetical protein ACTSRG_00255 [Candidatus Helarchaeota archaeon]
MLRKIIKLWENSDFYLFIKNIETIFFEQMTFKAKNTQDPHEHLKNYNLEIIKGIGPKIKTKLNNFGIRNPYDLIKCQSLQGVSETRLSYWKQCALSL